MSKQANKTLIGVFVAGAIALLCAAIVLFGSGQFFKQTSKYVLFFDASISGLHKGSPVVFRGVPVGQVSQITLTGNLDKMLFRTPVFIELDPGTSNFGLENLERGDLFDEFMLKLYNSGLRARLTSQSMLTGQLMVELDFFPLNEAGPQLKKVLYYHDTPEIPTIPSRMDSMLQTFSALPVNEIADNVLDITQSLKSALDSADLNGLVSQFEQLVQQLKQAMARVDDVVDDVHTLASSYSKLADATTTNMDSTFTRLNTAMDSVNLTVKNINDAVTGVRGVLNPSSVPVVEFNRALRELTEAARAIRSFANMLNRNPEALLRGKGAK